MAENRCMYCMGEKEPGQRVCPHCGHDDSQLERSEYALPPGSVLHNGKYVVGRVLGQGGFGITYIGFDMELKMKVAIKEYYPRSMAARTTASTSLYWQTNTDEQNKGRETFIKEARHMAQIQNAIDSVVRVQEIFYQNQTAYIIMNYIEGETLKEYLQSHGVLSWEDSKKLLKPVMKALSQAHQNGMIHRDVSPDNIMIDRQGKVWLLDMGASKEVGDAQSAPNLSQSTHMVVRNGFSPLEQYTDSGQIGPWTDVYAVCATMYYCMTGQVVPDSPSRVYHPEISFPNSFSSDIKAVLTHGLSLKPSERYRSMSELEQAITGSPPPPPPPPPPLHGFFAWIKRHKTVSAIAMLALVCLSVFGGLTLFRHPSPITVETLGTSNANMLNYGGWAQIEDEYTYYIGADNALYVCEYDKEDESFYLGDDKQICEQAGYITLGGDYVYFAATMNRETCGIYRMNHDGDGITQLTSNQEGRTYRYVNYVRLSDQSEYIYYCLLDERDGLTASLYRYNLAKGVAETVLDKGVYVYNIHGDSIYFIRVEDEGKNILLMKSDLDGRNIQELNRDKRFIYGIIADDQLYLYSMNDEAILVYNLDGTRNENFSGLYNIDLNTDRGFGYENGWFYYNNTADQNIHRVRTNGTGDTVFMEDAQFAQICSVDNVLWVLAEKETDKNRQIEMQMYIAFKDSDRVLDINDPEKAWESLSASYTFDFEWEETEDGEGIVITGYKGEITSFEIPKTLGGKPVVSIGEEAFMESDIQEIGLPEGLQSIGNRAFFDCESLSFVGLPDSLTEIGFAAFGTCSELEKIDLPDELSSIAALAFAETSLSTVEIPAKVETLDGGTFAVRNSAGLEAYSVKEGNPSLKAIDGVLFYEGEYTYLVEYPSGREGAYVVPEGTAAIMSYAFAHCKQLTELTIPESVLVIGSNAFRDTGLTEITVNRRCKLPDELGDDNLTVNYYS